MPRNSLLSRVAGGGVIREMIVLRNKNFSKKEEKKKLKFLDKLAVKGYKNKKQDYRDEAREMYTTGKSGKNIRTERATKMAAGSVGGSLAKSADLIRSGYNVAPKQIAVGAALSAAAGTVDAAVGGYAVDKYRQHKLKKNPKAYEKKIDQINVAEGKMTEEEYAKKHYNKNK